LKSPKEGNEAKSSLEGLAALPTVPQDVVGFVAAPAVRVQRVCCYTHTMKASSIFFFIYNFLFLPDSRTDFPLHSQLGNTDLPEQSPDLINPNSLSSDLLKVLHHVLLEVR
jgi:hypothetical protein